jgi:tRNA threonylcarbamoyladenosine biosynthesis protein TsaE
MSKDELVFVGIDEATMTMLAQRLAPQLKTGGVVHLIGDLGTGKTTFARAALRQLGVRERVKSPTYSLIESYTIDGLALHHLDLYRIGDESELDFLGLAELTEGRSVLLVEWPERGGSRLPADLRIHLAHAGETRDLRFEALTARGRGWLEAIRMEPTA